MNKSIFLLTCLGLVMLLSTPSLLHAQQYGRSAGIRLGGTSGLTYKKFIVDEQAVETMVSGRNNGVQLTIMWVMHHPMEIAFNENFFFYYGVGGHVGVEKYDDITKQRLTNGSEFSYESKNYFAMGVDALIGMEYRMLTIPMSLSLDMKPYLNYVGMRKLKGQFWDVAIGIKYIF